MTTGIPATYILDRRGAVRKRAFGADDWSRQDQLDFIGRLLAEPVPAAPTTP